jgi:polyisoprenoid-binding protein YceI
VHDWTESVNKITGDAQIVWNEDGSFTIRQLSLKVDVSSIESEHGSIMDNKTFDALKGNSNPYITFKMTALNSIVKSGNGYLIKLQGDLTIAGKTKSVEISGMGYIKENGKLLFDGSKSLKMSEYGISPPTAMMGAMKVGDDVTIKFRVYYNMK